MRKWNGLHSLGLAALVWSHWFASPSLADEPPAELFAVPGPVAVVEVGCPSCRAAAGRSLSSWLDQENENLWSSCWGEWTVIPSSEQGVELVAYFESQCPYISSGGAATGSYQAWQPESGGFGCDPEVLLSRESVPGEAELHDEIQPGEPAEILLEIRDRMGLEPLMGTLFQPIDAASQGNAENAFVEEVRAFEEVGVADATPSCVCEEFATTDTVQDATAAATHELSPSDEPSDTLQLASAELAQLLRSTSRELEQSANYFEDCEAYSRADRLRELAAELRLEARTARRRSIR